MSRRAVLLRAVNVGDTSLKMADFRVSLGRAGATEAETIGAAGTAVVEVPASITDDRLEAEAVAALEKQVGFVTEVFVRGASEWDRVIRSNPFAKEAEADPARLVVTTLRSAPSASAWARAEQAIVGRERIAAGGRHAYVVYPDGQGRSKLTLKVLEKSLGVTGTSRNWNTVLTLRARLGPG